MDYEKAYKEALEQARFYYNNKPLEPEKKKLEKMFPELTESEDEKIRKMLIKVFKYHYGSNVLVDGIKVKDIVAHLEKQKEPEDKGEISDGYHTFNELYYYRMLYNAAFFNLLPKEWVHKSKKHHDGEDCFGGGWFIVMANLPTGQISNHYELKDWDLFQIPEKEVADEWDGHTPQEAAERLHKFLIEKQKEQKPVDEKLVDEIGKSVRKKWAIDFIRFLDEHRYDGKMCVSNGECMDIENAFISADWEKLIRYYNKYTQQPAVWSEDYGEEDLRTRFAFYTYKDEDDALYLSNVFVEEASRNKGFGAKILKAAEKVAEIIGASRICLKVKQNTPANAWYRKNGYGYMTFEDGYDWLEKRLEYLQPKQEWSEDDKRTIDRACVALRAYANGDLPEFLPSELIGYADKLQSLRPHWKPSEEQMEMLKFAKIDYVMGCVKDGLSSLYEDLKKLM